MFQPGIRAAAVMIGLIALGLTLMGQARAEPAREAPAGTTAAALANPPASQPGDRPAEKWASLPPRQWPQILLTHRAKFKGNRELVGASAFLIRTDSGRILGATAKHLLGPEGGVEPAIPLSDLNAAILSWALHPRTLPSQAITLDKLALSPEGEASHDALALTVKGTGAPPAWPLRLRPEPVTAGEKVYLVGVPYTEPRSRQNVYAGQVQQVTAGGFEYTIAPPVATRGFSGAPVLDAKGYLVGIHHGRAATNAEGASTAGVAQDVVTLLRLLNVK
jgi:hypothetical protein